MVYKIITSSIFILSSFILLGCHLYSEGDREAEEPSPPALEQPVDAGELPPNFCESDANCPSGYACESGLCSWVGLCDRPAGEHEVCLTFETNSECNRGICSWCDGQCASEELECNWEPHCSAGAQCDARNTCIPDRPSCQGEVQCDGPTPDCPPMSTPAIFAGCYTGTCMAKTDCPDGAPFGCSDFNLDEQACLSDKNCEVVYRGVNCTSDTGEPCNSSSQDCSCESFEIDRCETL